MNYQIIPGILRTTETEYVHDLTIAQTFASFIQVDVVDVSIAEKPTVGFDIIQKHPSPVPIELDLMIKNPENSLEQWLTLPFVTSVNIHLETTVVPQRCIDMAKAKHINCGVALHPDQDLSALDSLQHYDHVQFMTVVPGKQGQQFRDDVIPKISVFHAQHGNITIGVDGGVNEKTLQRLYEAGASRFVSGSYIMLSDNPEVYFHHLSRALPLNT